MGEANRRKRQDPNYGKPSLFIGISKVTEKFIVCLKVKTVMLVIYDFSERKDAEHILYQCQECLDCLGARHWNKNTDCAIIDFISNIKSKCNNGLLIEIFDAHICNESVFMSL